MLAARRIRAIPLTATSRTTTTVTASRTMSSTRTNKQEVAPPGYSIDKSVGPTYRFQRSLPNLPVPTLESTATKYLESIRPLVSSNQPGTPTASAQNPTPEYAATAKAVEEFLASDLVKTLQERLVHRATAEGRDSWLSEWWNDAAYMGYRDPLVPYVSYFYLHKDDKSRRTGPKRAAALVRALLFFRRLTETHQIEPEMAKKLPLCMSSYKYLFNACRNPVVPSDTATKHAPDSNNHLAVVRKGHFYEISLTLPNSEEWLSAADLEKQLQAVVADADAKGQAEFPVGALTNDNRDVWYDARQGIVADQGNKASLEKIESAVIVLCLDDNKPVTREEMSWNAWVGDGKNRFFDKQQLIVSDNGRSAYEGEHSCMDGTTTSRLNDFMLRSLDAGKIDLGTPSSAPLPAPKPLTFNLASASKSAITKAITNSAELMGKHTLHVLQYEGYGKNYIKKTKTSPDSWAQLCMQLAYYKMEGELGGTYESAQTRKFKLGRTEVIRSATTEALEWCKAMEGESSDKERLGLFRKAVAKHVQYAGWAADGQGVDRHLFGLKKLLKEGETLPSIYTDPTFARSSHWKLSTSQLASEYFTGWGYGEVVPDGYGLAYAVNNDSVRFTITTLTGKGDKLRAYLEEAAAEMREMVQKAEEKAKL